MQKAISQAPTEFSKVVADSDQVAAQNRALNQLQQIGNEGGLRLQDKEALQESMLKGQAQERANRQGVVDEMARRGLGGSGFDLQARLAGQQGVADRMANNSLQVAAGAQDRALQAIMGAGQLAGQYRQQGFNEQSAKAAAADRINAFNTANLRDVNASNTQAQNAGQMYNLQNAQRISDQNTQLDNAEKMYNANLIQQNYQNQMARLSGANGQAGAMASTAQRGGELLGNTISNIGSAASNYGLLNSYLNGKNKNSASGSGYSQDEEE
jgi:hypothetical protein